MNKISYIIFHVYILLALCLFKINAIEIIFKYDLDLFKDLAKLINHNQNDNELRIRFVDPIYYLNNKDIPFDYDLTITSNITFIGNENGTIFDFQNDVRGKMKFLYNIKNNSNYKNTVKVENIHFINYGDTEYLLSGVGLLKVSTTVDNFQCIFKNCIFENSRQALIYIRNDYCYKPIPEESIVLFENCFFK